MLQVHYGKRKGRRDLYGRKCNLCGVDFMSNIPHRCFCEQCRTTSDLYRFHEWLPEFSLEAGEEDSADNSVITKVA